MARRTDNRDERDIAAAQLEPTAPVQDSPASEQGEGRAAATSGRSRGRQAQPTTEPPVTGVVGDASATESRSGDDARRRGWFWHWNSIVTQYAPMIGLKGVGLINSYTVWTDRRETSPHRGYAFPSQQREADFYGEDRAELITINKILVALDLIEIRKEMVLRTDERGRRWKVPHNFYRVKDHGDGFSLTSRDVLKVAELADRDRAVYRYLRRMFSPKFAPIDSQNVWHQILEEVRETEVWQRLAARTAKDESKASARSKAGHAARRVNDPDAVFSLPTSGDSEESEATGLDSANDSRTVGTNDRGVAAETPVAITNTGLATSVEAGNTGFGETGPTTVDPANTAPATSVQPTNSTYYQEETTTTTEDAGDFGEGAKAGESIGPGTVPDSSRSESIAINRFEEANARASTPAECRLLRQLADRFDPAARESGATGWDWLAEAIDDAVSAGSAFVAPRRVREILTRWERDGAPDAGPVTGSRSVSLRTDEPVTKTRNISHRSSGAVRSEAPAREPEAAFTVPVVTIEACGMTNRQVWAAVISDLQLTGAIGRADVATWLRDAAVLGVRDDGALLVGVPHDLAKRRATGRYREAIRAAVERVTGESFPIEVVLFREWAA
jgi:hypothetical protein